MNELCRHRLVLQKRRSHEQTTCYATRNAITRESEPVQPPSQISCPTHQLLVLVLLHLQLPLPLDTNCSPRLSLGPFHIFLPNYMPFTHPLQKWQYDLGACQMIRAVCENPIVSLIHVLGNELETHSKWGEKGQGIEKSPYPICLRSITCHRNRRRRRNEGLKLLSQLVNIIKSSLIWLTI